MPRPASPGKLRHRLRAASLVVVNKLDRLPVAAPRPVDGESLVDLLETPPPHAYRVKGAVAVRTSRGERRYVVNTVGRSIHIAADRRAQAPELGLVSIGHEMDADRAENRMLVALRTAETATGPEGMRRLRRYLRLSR